MVTGACSSPRSQPRSAPPSTTATPAATSSTTDPGTPALAAAIAAMQKQPSYDFAVRLQAGSTTSTITGEFIAPNRLSETVVQGGATHDIVVVGSVTASRVPGGKWSRSATTGTADPRQTFTSLAQASGVKKSGSAITFQLTGSSAQALVGAPTTVEGRVVIASGLISELSLQAATAPGVTIVVLYGHFGTKTAITLPAI